MPLAHTPGLSARLLRLTSTVVSFGLLTISLFAAVAPTAEAQSTSNSTDSTTPGTTSPTSQGQAVQGPVRLRSGAYQQRDADPSMPRAPTRSRAGSAAEADETTTFARPPKPPTKPSEFETFVQRLAGEPVKRFGSELMTSDTEPDAMSVPVPSDYVLKSGDEIEIAIWGSVDAELLLQVDRTGRINIPRVGAVAVAGVRYADVEKLIAQRVARVFKNFQLSVTLGQLRGLRVYVTGYVERPGAYVVPSLATMTQALMQAGGPVASGTFRTIQLRRGTQALSTVDLYDLLLKGDRGADRVVEADDVIHVNAVGREVALIGSVNRPAIFELLPNESIGDLMQMAGGFSAVADRTRLAIERLDERIGKRIVQLELPQAATAALSSGDVVRAFSVVDTALPVERQNKRVRIEGEVARPGDYVLPARSTIAEALKTAGGLTEAAFVYGTEFTRESVRVTQQQNYERAVRDLETELARYNTSQRTTTADEAAAQGARATATTRLIERLRAVKPSGRVVLQLAPETRALPDLVLDDGDRILVPPRPTSVGVFGSVYNGGSYLYNDGRRVDDFLTLAGGPTRGADVTSMFVIRANGSVVAERSDKRSWWTRGTSAVTEASAEPGDTIFVPEELEKTTFIQNAKDWGLIVSQFGLGVAAILAITR